MTVTKERKTELISQYRRNEADSGSPEVQISVLTARINNLTEHMGVHGWLEGDFGEHPVVLPAKSKPKSAKKPSKKKRP